MENHLKSNGSLPLVEDAKGRNKRRQILEAAARQFSSYGFQGANMRDVAAEAGVMAGSIYYHFESKEALFIAVHAAAVDMMTEAVRRATHGTDDPWLRLEQAAAAHCEALNGPDAFMGVIAPIFPLIADGVKNQLTAQRDGYERMFAALVEEVDIPAGVDAKIFRLHLLAALNGTKFWYRPGGHTPAEIGRQLVRMLRGARSPEMSYSAVMEN
ncbi:MAG: TetR/AcrR family transcriptional regulator [Alphaproteobacteria bacterium]|nr:TetR/AcrR family transcriptional regulator [Alphaproteobacteria bacterium]